MKVLDEIKSLLFQFATAGCVMAWSVPFAQAEAPRVYVSFEATQDSSPPTSQDVQAASHLPECRPSELDPDGNWGFITEGFQLSVRVSKKQFRLGEAVAVVLLLRNTTQQELGYSAYFGTGMDSPLGEFVVADESYRAVPRIAPLRGHIDGSSRWFSLHPGTQRRYSVPVHTVYHLTKPASYVVSATARVPKLDGTGYFEVQSGNASFHISGTQNSFGSVAASTNASPAAGLVKTELDDSLQSVIGRTGTPAAIGTTEVATHAETPLMEIGQTGSQVLNPALSGAEIAAAATLTQKSAFLWKLWLLLVVVPGASAAWWLLRRKRNGR